MNILDGRGWNAAGKKSGRSYMGVAHHAIMHDIRCYVFTIISHTIVTVRNYSYAQSSI